MLCATTSAGIVPYEPPSYKSMVLVSDKPSSYMSIIQTNISHRERHEARRIGLEPMPLDEDMKSHHGEREACVEVLPDPVHALLEVADERQHGAHRLDAHPILPRATLTQCEIARIALRGMETGVTQDNHLVFALANEPLQGGIRDSGGGACPPHDPPPLIEEQGACAADNPAVVRHACAADLPWAAALAHRMEQLDAGGVDDTPHRWGGSEDVRPVVMRREETQEPGALGEARKQRAISTRYPAREGLGAHAFEGLHQPQGDHLTGPEVRLRRCGDGAYLLINLRE